LRQENGLERVVPYPLLPKCLLYANEMEIRQKTTRLTLTVVCRQW